MKRIIITLLLITTTAACAKPKEDKMINPDDSDHIGAASSTIS